MKIREINLFRTIPVCLGITFSALFVFGRLSVFPHAPSYAGTLLSVVVTSVVCLLVRFGKLPWFEMKDGKKHGFIVWLETKLPFLSAGFYRK